VTSWTPSLWKASLHHATLKTMMLFFPTSWLQSCLHKLQKKQVSIMHQAWLSYSPFHPKIIIQCSPWAYWYPQQNWKP
jgi:hypothetical protein